MNRKPYQAVILLLAISLVLQACVPSNSNNLVEPKDPSINGGQSSNVEIAAISIPAVQNPIDPMAAEPAEIARRFFDAYTSAMRNSAPVFDSNDFDAQKYLSSSFRQQVIEIQAGFNGSGFDPILQTQDIPQESPVIKEARINGTQAQVVLQFGSTGIEEQPFEREVSLELIDGEWLIVPDWIEGSAATPENAVEDFYTWYLAYINNGMERRNALVDRAYRAAPYLSPSFVDNIDRLLSGSEEVLYDPFICAQDVPTTVKAVARFNNGSRPTVLVETSFPGHYLTLDLIRMNFNMWAITNITCGSTPTGVAKAFYTWALGYMTKDEEMHNPWIDRAYYDSPFLSTSFINNLDVLLSSSELMMIDPILIAQDLPMAFTTETCSEKNCALVNMQFGDSLIHQLRLDFTSQDGSLRIDKISHPSNLQPVEMDGWRSFIDEQYGYAIRYPMGWTIDKFTLANQDSREKDPLVRKLDIIPTSGAEYIPLSMEVVLTSEDEFFEYYYLGEILEEKQVNGYTAQVYRSDPGIIYYVFQHPVRENIWVVITDSITQFPGREEYARSIEGILNTFVSTISFE